MKGVAAMSVFLGQLPPAELARLKAELAETLIANFCYPRFFDHRTNSLRMRPVDRAKRQEVWLYLSSIDFTTWNRVDLMSSDFQRYIERLIIFFVQRNRSFFGQQGRKRMSDVRILISSCATLVAEGMRGHLMGNQPGNPPFGSPRPAISWSTTNGSGYPEPNWEQIVSATMILQQQLQAVRGDIKTAPALASEVQAIAMPSTPSVPSTPPASRRPKQAQKKSENGVGSVEHAASASPIEQANGKSTSRADRRSVSLPPPSPPSGPLASPAVSIAASTSVSTVATPPDQRADPVVWLVETPTSPTPVVGRSAEIVVVPSSIPEQVQPATGIPATPAAQPWRPQHPPQTSQPSQPPPTAQSLQPLQTPPPPTPVTGVEVAASPSPTRSVAPVMVNEDVAIFERMHHQLVLWLRIEVVRLGMDIAGQTPLQLLELLRQQDSFDETRLQVVSTLLNLSNQVMKNGQASLFDYKQGLMFYLMHTQH